MADIDVVNAYMEALTIEDLPAAPVPGPDFDPITPAVINRAIQIIQEHNGSISPWKLKSIAWREYAKKFSIPQMKMIINAYRNRVAELTSEE